MSFAIHDGSALLSHLSSFPGETDTIEFKENNVDPTSIGKYVSALANSAMYEGQDFAFLVWGIADGSGEVVGTTADIARAKVGNDELLFWLNRQIRPQTNVMHEVIWVEGKKVEMLCIEPSYREPVLFKGEAFVRIGNAVQPLTANPERARVIWTNTSRFCFEDGRILHHIDEKDILERFDARRLCAGLSKRAVPADRLIENLVTRELIVPDNQAKYDVTALLALACANDFDKYPSLLRKGLRVTLFEGQDKLETKSDMHGSKGYATTFENALAYVMERIPHRENMTGGVRNEDYAIPEISIREFLANAIIHQDIVEGGDGPRVEIFSDRVRIINPGEPLVDPERFIDAPSKSRNAKFGRLMREFGLCEERGSGVDRAITAIEDAVLPPPLFQSVEGSTVVTVFMAKKFADMTPEERVRACYQHACVRFEKNDPMSNASLRERLGLAQRQYPQVSNVIRDAIEAGKIRPRDEDQANRQARYVPSYA